MGVETLVREKTRIISDEDRFNSFLWNWGLQATEKNPAKLIKSEKIHTERFNEKGPWNLYLFTKQNETPQVKVLCSTYQFPEEIMIAVDLIGKKFRENNKDTYNTGLVIEDNNSNKVYAGYFDPYQNPESAYSHK